MADFIRSGPGSAESKKGGSALLAELREVAQEFESLFIYQMLKSMREALPEGGFFKGGPGQDIFMSMMDQHLASALAEGGGFGLAEKIIEELAPAIGGEQRTEEGFASPLDGRISSHFGMRIHPILGKPAHHNGVDIAAPTGTEISAAAEGRVLFSGSMPEYGNLVVIDHEGGFTSLYAHNDANYVQANQWVGRGQVIARVGSTGRATGPHLHFELHLRGNPIDPQSLVVAINDSTSKKG